MRRFIRNAAFELSRRDLAAFLEENQADLLHVFHDELQKLDDAIPEENLFIDINMVGLGDAVIKAALSALTRFLRDDIPPPHSAMKGKETLERIEGASAQTEDAPAKASKEE